ncbi:hypothetical protein [Rhizobium sp. A37_96]
MFRFIRFLVVVYIAIVAVDYVRDNIPNWGNFLKLPLPQLPPNIANMLGDPVADINKQSDKLEKMVDNLLKNPPPGLNALNPLSTPSAGSASQDIQKTTQEIHEQTQKLTKQLHLPNPPNPIPKL